MLCVRINAACVLMIGPANKEEARQALLDTPSYGFAAPALDGGNGCGGEYSVIGVKRMRATATA
jgi:hypothetical protein